MFAEIRISWFLLFILTVSAAAKQHAEDGAVSAPMCLLILAHFLYANACAKGTRPHRGSACLTPRA